MKEIVALIVAAVLLPMAPVLATGHATDQQPSESRRVSSRKGTPILQSRLEGERELIVEKDASPPLEVEPPPGMSPLEWYTSVSDVVLIANVVGIEPSLTKDADWITSAVSARVTQVLKSPEAVLWSEGLITFRQDGGEMDLGGTHVRAVLPWAAGYEVGKSYLIFASLGEDGRTLIFGPESTFKIDASSTLRPLAFKGKMRDEQGVSLTAAKDRIRVAATQRR